MKICTKCKIEKEEELFSKNKSWCKACVKAYSAKHYQDNKKDILEAQKIYNKENEVSRKEYYKTYRKEHKSDIITRQQKWNSKNVDHVKSRRSNYYQENKEEILKDCK